MNQDKDRDRQTHAKADALCKAAIQATARALHTAQLAADALKRSAGETANNALALDREAEAQTLLRMRDHLLEAYASVPDGIRERMLRTQATITSDELIDLLALCVRG